MKVNPLRDRVVLKKEAEKVQTSSGLFIPTGALERDAVAEVVAIGKGVISPDLAVGKKVIYKEYSVTEIKIEDEELLIIKEEDILTTLEED